MADEYWTPKRRMLSALQGERPDVIPAVPAYTVLFVADFERLYYVEQYRRRLRGYSSYAIDHEEDTRFRAEALFQAYGIFKERPDWIEVYQGASRAWAARTEIVSRNGVLYYHDLESDVYVPMHTAPIPHGDARLTPASSATSDLWDLTSRVRSAEEIDAAWPVLTAEELLARGDFDLPRLVIGEYGDRVYLSTIMDTPFSDAYDLFGFQGMMLIQHDRPDLLHHFLARDLDRNRELMRAWADVGVHGTYVQEVFTGADIISPRAYDEYVFAYNQPYFREMRELGLVPIHYVCGDVIPRLNRIASYDIAAVAVEESKKSFNIEIDQVVDRVDGRVAVLGNVDAVRFGLQATMEEMAAEVKRQVRVGARAKGFVVSTGSPFPLDTNPRLVDTLVATAHSMPG